MDIKLIIAKGMRYLLRPAAIRASKIDKTARVCPGSNVNYSSLGRYSYIGNDCYTFQAQIGSFCCIGDDCKIGSPTHPIEWVSMSPVFCSGKNVMNVNFSKHKFKENEILTVIGNDVWIGAGAYIKSGVSIGDGAVIGMGSIVTHDIPPYEIWAGNPAKKIRSRFDNNTVQDLMTIKWWDWSEEKLRQEAIQFNNMNDFLKFHCREKKCVK